MTVPKTKKDLVEYLNKKDIQVTEADKMSDLWLMYRELKKHKTPQQTEEIDSIINTEKENVSDEEKEVMKITENLFNNVSKHDQEIKFLKIALISVVIIVIGSFIVLIIKKKTS